MSKDPFLSLLEKLRAEKQWPQVYMFKFISPADNQTIAKVQELFDASQAQISMRESRNGNYVAISVKELMLTPENVIERCRLASEIPGVMVL
ncbi:MAG: DUF493 family protein [Flavobacteriales bacterium]|nr:MAG: DUF493 family protein [Flavobacteriales bacterium]